MSNPTKFGGGCSYLHNDCLDPSEPRKPCRCAEVLADAERLLGIRTASDQTTRTQEGPTPMSMTVEEMRDRGREVRAIRDANPGMLLGEAHRIWLGQKAAPRMWEIPAEPGPEVKAVKDREGDVLVRSLGGWAFPENLSQAWSWGILLAGSGQLFDATGDDDA